MPNLESKLKTSVAGIDVHKENLVCCVARLQGEEYLYKPNTFKSTQDGLCKLIEWLKKEEVELILMESTGVLWKAPYTALEEANFDIAVVNASDMKRWESRKTDANDAQCLADAAKIGSFARSFIPSKDFRDLRNVSRLRTSIMTTLQKAKNQASKMFSDAGCRISLVCSDMWGKAGRQIMEGLINGLTPEEIISSLGNNCKLRKSKEEIKECIAGKLSEHHKFSLRYLLKRVDEYLNDLSEFDAYLFGCLKELGQSEHVDRLQTIPGISKVAACQILVELGDNLGAFRNVSSFASWIGICPGNHESAGKNFSGHCGKGNKYLRRTLCECSNAASRTKNTGLYLKYNAIKARRGSKKAKVAIAHKIARIVYTIIIKQDIYRDLQIDYSVMSKKKHKQRFVNKLIELGYSVVDTKTGESVKLDRLQQQL